MIGELIEALLEFVLESAIEGSNSSKLPKPVRIFFKVTVFAVYAGLTGFFILISAAAFRDGDTGMGIFMAVLAAAFIIVSIVKLVKKLKR